MKYIAIWENSFTGECATIANDYCRSQAKPISFATKYPAESWFVSDSDALLANGTSC